MNNTSYTLPLTQKAYEALKANTRLVKSINYVQPGQGDWLYPLNMHKDWTADNYGPVWIPKKGESIHLTEDNYLIYERPIRVYEGNNFEVRDGKFYINGQQTDTYTFKMDYYWMMGRQPPQLSRLTLLGLCARRPHRGQTHRRLAVARQRPRLVRRTCPLEPVVQDGRQH